MATPAKTLYDEDFIAWTEQMARLIENRQTDGLDWANLAEEIRDLGISKKDALKSHLAILLMHLIKWEIQPARRSRSWEDSISNARTEIDMLLESHPSLKRELSARFDATYDRARRIALRETHLSAKTPITSWSQEQVLDHGFLPG